MRKTIRFTEEVAEELSKLIHKKDMNFSEYIKEAVNFYQKNPHEYVEELTQNIDSLNQIIHVQSDHINKLANVLLLQKERLDELETLTKRVFNQSLFTYKTSLFAMKNASADPEWQKMLDDIRNQMISIEK